MAEVAEVAAKMSRIVMIPRTIIACYIVTRKGNLGKSVKSVARTQEGEDNLNPNIKFGSYLTRGRNLFVPSNNVG